MKHARHILSSLWAVLLLSQPETFAHEEKHATKMGPAIDSRQPVCLKTYPTRPDQFHRDLQPLVAKIIAAHGAEEWKATLLTNELHRHLGTYSIIGAKMGIRARELLGAEFDELRVESRAGLKPPLSCLNDGLQVSTGASLGRGTITVVEARPPAPEAVFIHGNQRLRLRLKPAVVDRIRADIAGAIKQHGDLTPAYFDAVRKLSLQSWLEMKRTEMFDETFESQ